MLKRKIAGVFAGTAMLGALSFAPLAGAQSDVSSSVYDPATGTWRQIPPTAPSASTVPDSPRGPELASADARRQTEDDVYASTSGEPGLVPSPYRDMPASGHAGDQFFYRGTGGVSP